ncbi:HIT domain-containing protein [Candidatus Pacearchaeota archaeon]|nr:HIT domain-containing protein [Candidatus Pacearchaeota archaeon]
MKNCIFCKMVKGEIPSVKIWEDKNFIAILDKFPNVKGMTLIIPKKHSNSYVFDMPDKNYSELMIVAKKIGLMLDKKLKVKRTAMVMEGLGVNHAHIKLYPIYGLDEKFKETWAKDKVYFNKYQGYISTQLGHEKSTEELKKVAEEILNKRENRNKLMRDQKPA